MKRTIQKLFKGCADVPDYKVKECIDNQEDLIIYFNDEYMILTPHDLVTKKKYTSNNTYGDTKPYRLVGYLWRPSKVEQNI